MVRSCLGYQKCVGCRLHVHRIRGSVSSGISPAKGSYGVFSRIKWALITLRSATGTKSEFKSEFPVKLGAIRWNICIFGTDQAFMTYRCTFKKLLITLERWTSFECVVSGPFLRKLTKCVFFNLSEVYRAWNVGTTSSGRRHSLPTFPVIKCHWSNHSL